MFTGLIEEVGKVRSCSNGNLSITCKKIMDDINIGDSVAVNGTCLTVTGIHEGYLAFHVSPTTSGYSRFAPGEIRSGEKMNLERAITLSTRLGGHIVSGHIDGKAKIIEISKRGNDHYFEFIYPPNLKSMIVDKGSVCLDGISLTVCEVKSSSFAVTVIPQTFISTSLTEKRIGDFMHIEADIFARYIYHILTRGEFDGKDQKIIESFCKR